MKHISSIIRDLIKQQEQLDENIKHLNQEREEIARKIIDVTLKELERYEQSDDTKRT